MKKLLLLAFLACPSFAQFSSTAAHIIWGTSLPAVCTPNTGDIFFKTSATVGPYYCSAANTWTAMSGGGGGVCPAGSANAVQKTNGTNCAASSMTDDGSTVTATANVQAPSFIFDSAVAMATPSASFRQNAVTRFGLFPNAAGTLMTFGRYNDAGVYLDDYFTGTRSDGSLSTIHGWTAANYTGGSYLTATNCADSAGAAACGSAAAGAFVVDAASTSTVVSTSAVTANSQVIVMFDSSLGTRLSVTCNTTVALPAITARTAATSFTVTVPAAPVTNPACFTYWIVN